MSEWHEIVRVTAVSTIAAGLALGLITLMFYIPEYFK
jgi:hypothetical protein